MNDGALVFSEVVGELENVANSWSTEPIKALVIIANHADIVAFVCQCKDELFLDVVDVLVFVDHQILEHRAILR